MLKKIKMMQPEKCSTLGTKTTTDQAGKFPSLNVRQPLGFTFHLRLKFGSAIARLTFKAVVSLAVKWAEFLVARDVNRWRSFR